MQKRRVAITGVGVVTSLGCDRETYWDNLVHGRSGIAPIQLFDPAAFTTRIASQVLNWDATKWLERRVVSRVDRFTQFALVAALQATQDAGLNFEQEDRDRIGVVIGTGIGGLGEMEEQHKILLAQGPGRVRPLLVPKLMSNAATGQVSIEFGLRGPNMTVVTACAAATHSLGTAFHILRDGWADIMIAGGTEAALTPLGLAGFCSAKAMSTRNDEPQRASRPFDRDRDGFIMGEGAGIVILEEMERAKRRGAPIYGEFRGFGFSGDAVHITQPDPEGAGAALAMRMALKDAEMNADEIDYVNAHGTSTELNDPMETIAMKKVFGDHAKQLAISSTKSMVGHLLGASGGVEMVAMAMSVRRGVVHPTANLENPDPACDLDYVPGAARELNIRGAMSNSFGFGGHNASIVIAKA